MISSAVVLTEERLREEAEYFARQDSFVFDVETAGANRGVPHLNTVTWMGMATYGRTIVIPMGHPIGTRVSGEHRDRRLCTDGKYRNYRVLDYERPPEQLSRSTVFGTLAPLFSDPGVEKWAHGASFDGATVTKYLPETPAPLRCSIVLDWIQNENRNQFGLKRRTIEEYGTKYDKENIGRRVEDFPFNKVAHYVFCDARYDWMLVQDQYDGVAAEGVEEIYDLENQILELMVQMRLTGARVDTERLEAMRKDMTKRVENIKIRLFQAAGKKFNLNSAPQKQQILYGAKEEGGQGLKPWRMTKGGKTRYLEGEEPDETGWSTDAEALESYPTNKVAKTLLEYQEVNKLLSTYVLGWLGEPGNDKKPGCIYDDRIFADFVQYGTVTGRFSCRDPNLQNIPRSDTPDGKLMRSAFVAEPGYSLVAADYDQIELVILAHYVHDLGWDSELYNGFMEGIDPHTMTAAMVLGRDPADVTSSERSIGKSLNFAITYGAGAAKVASMISKSTRKVVALSKAEGYLATHEEQFPEIYEFKEVTLDACRRATPDPHLKTILGRKRHMPDLLSKNWKRRSYAERQAFNSLIQGSSADLIKLAMIRAMNLYADQIPEAQIILSIHDELVVSSPTELSEDAAILLGQAMKGPEMQKLLTVPLKADVKVVQRWSDAK